MPDREGKRVPDDKSCEIMFDKIFFFFLKTISHFEQSALKGINRMLNMNVDRGRNSKLGTEVPSPRQIAPVCNAVWGAPFHQEMRAKRVDITTGPSDSALLG